MSHSDVKPISSSSPLVGLLELFSPENPGSAGVRRILTGSFSPVTFYEKRILL